MKSDETPKPTKIISLDGNEWLIAIDPENIGGEQGWWEKPQPSAKQTKTPWIIQDPFPKYHGVVWYWRDFAAPTNPHQDGRYLLRFWQVDYMARVWLNGQYIGEHEGGESVFIFDVTDAIKPEAKNALTVRVLNPTHKPIDGVVLNETPHRNKHFPIAPGADSNHGGIVDSVELLVTPPARITDLFVRPNLKTGAIHVQTSVTNAGARDVSALLEWTVAPAASGETITVKRLPILLSPGEAVVKAELRVDEPRPWYLNDPFLYRVTARLSQEGSHSFDETSVRCGFRDFRFENGYFRLNGRRIFLRCSHTGNSCPIGQHLPHDPDLLRRDLLNVKVMGFNAIRFIAAAPTRYQLDLCDEIGLMVYEEPYAAWCLADSPKMAQRYDESFIGMIRRDRNHPSVVIWGLLNETPNGPVFQHAAKFLTRLRELDDTRMVFLNSGRWDAQPQPPIVGLEIWHGPDDTNPNVTHNPTDHALSGLGITWQPGQMAFHPGPKGEYSVVRWTCPARGEYRITAAFASIAERATTDVHILHGAASLFDSFINVKGRGPAAEYAGSVHAEAGDAIIFAVGFGNGNYGADTTSVSVTIESDDGKKWDAAADFSISENPRGQWSYGYLQPGPAPDVASFSLYSVREKLAPPAAIGALSNPGSKEWEDVLYDHHTYPRVPHTAETIRMLRGLSNGEQPVFISEYGIGSAMHLSRVVRQYEQLGKAYVEDAEFYRGCLDQFMADWEAWRMDEAFASPDDYFDRTLAKMAGQRLLGLNAIRANPRMVGHSLTGTIDQGWTAEGLTTTFRELKPGTIDAVFDGFAPLRLCLFVEPVNIYRGSKVRLEAVLANEDALMPGEYPIRLQVVGPDNARSFDRAISITIPDTDEGNPPPFAKQIFGENVQIDGMGGKYRFIASFERGAAATGGEADFYVADANEMPPLPAKVVLCGDDSELRYWLQARGVSVEGLKPEQSAREAILVAGAPTDVETFRILLRHIARGATAIFLSPGVLKRGDDPVGWLPLRNKGSLTRLVGWLYLKDEWAKAHPIFDGLPAGGLMDYTFYREIIPDFLFSGQDPPAEAIAGAIKASQGYASGLMVAMYRFGGGRFLVNTLLVRENLGRHPAAERLLRNMLRYAAADAPIADLPNDFDQQLKALGYE